MDKVCRTCGEKKHVSEFRQDRKGYIRKDCLECDRAKSRERQVRRKDKMGEQEYKKTLRVNKRKWMKETTVDKRREIRRGWKSEGDKPHLSPNEWGKIKRIKRKINEIEKEKRILYSDKIVKDWERSGGCYLYEWAIAYWGKLWMVPSTLDPAWLYKVKYRNIPEFNAAERLRNQVTKKAKQENVATLIRGAVNRNGSSPMVESLLGYSIKEFCNHFESKFNDGMSWDHFKRGEIHIDHIKPKVLFDCKDEEQFQHCWSLSNLQPLWSEDNLRKGARVA